MNDLNYSNNIISLEEDDSFGQSKHKKNKKQDNNNKSKTSNSFFGKLINSVSKIGQGLRNIMSMKINYEDEDDFNSNLYNQISNRFNNNEEISLIDAPSFMEESNIQNQSNKKNESNIMMISQNEINNDDDIVNNNNAINNIEDFKNSLDNQKEEITNTKIVPNNKGKLRIKSTFLNKKRYNDHHLENIMEEKDEEEKNEEENLNINISENENNRNNKNKEENSLNSSKIKINKSNSNIKNNTFKMDKNNTSMMSLSMKSMDNLKNEISKRREENLRSIKEMYNKYELKYDSKKEEQIRDKILDDYFKEKAKRIAEGKLKMEREKQKREEEFNKLKIRKESGFKFSSIQKKPNIFSEAKNAEIHFKPISNIVNSSNNFNTSKKEEIKQPNTMPKINTHPNLNITFGNINNSLSQNHEIKVENNDIKDNDNININKKNNELNSNEEKKTIFGFNEMKKEENSTKKENESKPDQKLFNYSGNNLSIINNENIKQGKINTEPSLFGINNINKGQKEVFDNKKKSIFDNFIVPQTKVEEKKEEKIINNDKKQEDFFGSSNNIGFMKNDKNSLFQGNSNTQNIFNAQVSSEKGGIFDQNNNISKEINQQPLFNSNKIENSLFNKNNLFANINNSHKESTTSLFGSNLIKENDISKQTPDSGSIKTFSMGYNPNSKGLFG